MPTVIEVFGFVFVSQALTCWAELGFEPVCSKFDYEEKLLAKTMGLENRIDEIGERVTRIESLLEAQQEKKTPQKKTCPSNYMYSPRLNLCWRHDKNHKLNWFEAAKVCQKEGGHLIIFDSTETIRFIQEYLRAAGSSSVYIGASDITEEGVFTWINGKQAQHIPWESGQPNRGANQNCLALYTGSKFQPGDSECSSKREVLCQFDLN